MRLTKKRKFGEEKEKIIEKTDREIGRRRRRKKEEMERKEQQRPKKGEG